MCELGGVPAPVRRAKVFQPSTSSDIAAIDVSDWTLEDFGPVSTLDELEAHARRPSVRLRRLVKTPWWAVDRYVARRRSRRQQTTRGWTDGELWNLDVYICERLGTMLAAQVDQIRNHPPELEYEEWRDQVRAAGAALLGYDPDDEQRVAEARAALRWVADNLVDLWD